jgi:hypothetical protein
VTCDEVRELLPEHLLGTLDPAADAAVGIHLRGCTACRRDMVALADGVSTFAAAAHDVEPPEELRDRVLGVLEEEWAGVPAGDAPHRRTRWAWRAAAVAALVAALAWGAVATMRASDLQVAADKYEAFLGVLGGEDVRVGELRAEGSQELRGSVVIYDSKVGQSWVLVLVRAPGREGEANVTMVDGGRTIDLHPLEFDPGGEGSTWLVTPSDLTGFNRVNLWNDEGLIASAAMRRA